MPLRITVKIDTTRLQRQLKEMQRQVPFATARALTLTAKAAVGDIQSAMRKDFDRPTSYALGGWASKPASKTNLQSWVGSREGTGSNRPASTFLAPEILGGDRHKKAFEVALAALSHGQFIVPGPGAPVDANGNIQRSEINRILASLTVLASPTAKISERNIARLKKRGVLIRSPTGQLSQYFVGMDRNSGRPKGIFKIQARGKVAMILRFTTKTPRYQVRLPFEKIVQASVQANLPVALDQGVRQAIATATRK